MLVLDHFAVIAPTLEEGVAHAQACLGVEIPPGGAHPEMGTHNHLLRIDQDLYLEVIAVDPAAPPPRSGPRWFGFEDAPAVRAAWDRGDRLASFVARTDDIDALLAAHGDLYGGKTSVSRGGRRFSFTLLPDGRLPGGGALPSVIDRSGRPSPAARMPESGVRLREFVIEHPDPGSVRALYARVGLIGAPRVEHGARLRYHVVVETPGGVRTLT